MLKLLAELQNCPTVVSLTVHSCLTWLLYEFPRLHVVADQNHEEQQGMAQSVSVSS
ncbi:hypothetical protein TIFTF001_035027 [Ficus carica]|uniref:Uncharacterized protein n=1 Tax=Ficus carica TaxID=3494 RepID=A0AA88J5Y3_FICCA|nr:hypothetical protein TIFTF001_035027 [Ficus carica]